MEIMKKKREQQLLQTKNASGTQQAHHRRDGARPENIVVGKRPVQQQNLQHAVAKKIILNSSESPKDVLQYTSWTSSAKTAKIKERVYTQQTTQVTA